MVSSKSVLGSRYRLVRRNLRYLKIKQDPMIVWQRKDNNLFYERNLRSASTMGNRNVEVVLTLNSH